MTKNQRWGFVLQCLAILVSVPPVLALSPAATRKYDDITARLLLDASNNTRFLRPSVKMPSMASHSTSGVTPKVNFLGVRTVVEEVEGPPPNIAELLEKVENITWKMFQIMMKHPDIMVIMTAHPKLVTQLEISRRNPRIPRAEKMSALRQLYDGAPELWPAMMRLLSSQDTQQLVEYALHDSPVESAVPLIQSLLNDTALWDGYHKVMMDEQKAKRLADETKEMMLNFMGLFGENGTSTSSIASLLKKTRASFGHIWNVTRGDLSPGMDQLIMGPTWKNMLRHLFDKVQLPKSMNGVNFVPENKPLHKLGEDLLTYMSADVVESSMDFMFYDDVIDEYIDQLCSGLSQGKGFMTIGTEFDISPIYNVRTPFGAAIRGLLDSYHRTLVLTAIIGNIVTIAVVVLMSCIKYKTLMVGQQLGKTKASDNAMMEKVMRRDVTLEELRNHNLPGDLWMAVDGFVCDITEFVNVHPGGADLLLTYAGTDATEHFNEVGHSNLAKDLIKERLVGVLSDANVEHSSEQSNANLGILQQIKNAAKQRLPAKVLSLFTKEDRFNFHKLVGVIVIGHYIWRYVIALKGEWLYHMLHFKPGPDDPMGFDGSWFSLFSVWFCIVLQLSSFQFILPRNRVLGKPMLWQEWRAHNLIFTLRSLFGFTAVWIGMHWNWHGWKSDVIILCLCFGAILFQLNMVDVVSKALRDSKHESLTASWPLWDGCPLWLERCVKFYYSIGINQLTMMVMMHQSRMLPSLYFIGILILQTDSFAMTLVRKNIIKTESFHAYYLWNMWHAAWLPLMTFATVALMLGLVRNFFLMAIVELWAIPVAVYFARFNGLSKYGCWTGVFVRFFLDLKVPGVPDVGFYSWLALPAVWLVWALGQRLVAGFVFEYRIRRFLEGGRLKPMRLKSRECVGGSLYKLSFEMPVGFACGLMPGQHVKLAVPNMSRGSKTWNGHENLEEEAEEISRSYTPISPPEASCIEVLVKHYEHDVSRGFPQGGRASKYLIGNAKIGDNILASGPHGHRIYFGNGYFEVMVGQPRLRPRKCAFLAGGSGITPAISVIREVQAETRRKNNAAEAWRMLDWENGIELESIEVLHVNRMTTDALPLTFYEDPCQPTQLIPISVRNLITGPEQEKDEDTNAKNNADINNEDACSTWNIANAKLTKEAIIEAFHAPADDMLVIVCGPSRFVSEVCQPLLAEIGYKHVIGMY